MKNKYAFTIAEAMVCFVLMGILFVGTLASIKISDHYDKLYWQAFNTLYQASKAASEKFETSDEGKKYKAEWKANQDNTDRYKYPGFLGKYGTTKFCNRLVEFINVTDKTSCGKHEGNIQAANTKITSTNGKFGVNFYDGYSTQKKGEGDTYDKVDSIAPSFTSINGQRFFIFPPLRANFDPTNNSFGVKLRETYIFVAVDLNGDAKPNTQFIKNGRNPDIVLFAIDSQGNVIPLGLPEFSKAYLNAMVYYPTDVDNHGKPLYPKIHSKAESLWHAKKMAWGYSEDDEGACSADSSSGPYLQNISEYEPLSQSTKFYYMARYCINNLDSCANENASEESHFADKEFVYLVSQFLYKAEDSDEIYDYLIEDDCRTKNTTLDKNGCNKVKSKETVPRCGIDFKHDN